ncbi:MAG TPA: winged helix-turn-helix domain-containing protein [Candidatus Binatus sp.]|jgi:two-component system, OmpR family, copper resistance phosphate regulon response regulator CusR|nr:winged helix-turn-helix domain-containing protein [Candidatus Binatus sp.]
MRSSATAAEPSHDSPIQRTIPGEGYAIAVLVADNLELNRIERTVTRGGRPIDLTRKEFALLEFLMCNAGHPLTRMQIVENVWHLSFDTMTNIVDVYINYVRKKVDADWERKLIRTIRGIGYELRADH